MTEINFVKTYSPLTSEEIVAKEKSNMDEKRFKHCIGVSETSRKLAELNNYDPDKAALAGPGPTTVVSPANPKFFK